MEVKIIENNSIMQGAIRLDPVALNRALDSFAERVERGDVPVISHINRQAQQVGNVGVVKSHRVDGGDVYATIELHDSPLKNLLETGSYFTPSVDGIYRGNTNELRTVHFQHVAVFNTEVDKLIEGN